jgi:protein TonB
MLWAGWKILRWPASAINPSLIASKNFRYQLREIDGRAVAVPNVKNTFTYRIE